MICLLVRFLGKETEYGKYLTYSYNSYAFIFIPFVSIFIWHLYSIVIQIVPRGTILYL